MNISRMTTSEVRAAMSIAGEPDKAITLIHETLELITRTVDVHNIPSLDNAQFAIERVVEELKQWQSMERERQGL